MAEAGVDHRAEGAVLDLVKRVSATLRAMPAADVAKATAIKGFLRDLGFAPTVSPTPTRAGGSPEGAAAACSWPLLPACCCCCCSIQEGGCWSQRAAPAVAAPPRLRRPHSVRVRPPSPAATVPAPLHLTLARPTRPSRRCAEGISVPPARHRPAGGQLCAACRHSAGSLPGPGGGDPGGLLRQQGPAQPQVGWCAAVGPAGALPAAAGGLACRHGVPCLLALQRLGACLDECFWPGASTSPMDWLLGSWHAILRPHVVRTLCCSRAGTMPSAPCTWRTWRRRSRGRRVWTTSRSTRSATTPGGADFQGGHPGIEHFTKLAACASAVPMPALWSSAQTDCLTRPAPLHPLQEARAAAAPGPWRLALRPHPAPPAHPAALHLSPGAPGAAPQ